MLVSRDSRRRGGRSPRLLGVPFASRGDRGHATRDRGAVAVEFALLLPMLLLLVFGIIDFGRALNAQITLTQAAREGARLASLGDSTATNGPVVTGTENAATGLSPIKVTATSCPPGAGVNVNAVVNVSYTFSSVTPISAIAGLFGSGFSSSMTLYATGVMPCET